MSDTLHVLSAGAAQGLVATLQRRLLAETGCDVQGAFGAVGAMREKLLAGARCDVVILTAKMIAELEREGRVVAGSAAPVGRVLTGVAVREGDPPPVIAGREALRAALAAADAIYFPDPERATAGIHFARVLRELSLYERARERCRTFANGATAMGELARATAARPIGCTQVTEILYTPGVTLVGPLPAEFELATVYSVALCRESEAARRLVASLAGPEAAEIRMAGGFEPA
jgi:molybdate transport system substrate-binding protein